jgi:hypothetical protein
MYRVEEFAELHLHTHQLLRFYVTVNVLRPFIFALYIHCLPGLKWLKPTVPKLETKTTVRRCDIEMVNSGYRDLWGAATNWF